MTSLLLIPVYELTDKTLAFFQTLTHHINVPIIFVNDGSNSRFDERFLAIIKMSPTIRFLHYSTNHGKGYALRYSMQYIWKNFPQTSTIITADGDGQHSVEDISHILTLLEKLPANQLLLGVRHFTKASTPKKSYYGNRITSYFFLLASGIKLEDTQTGLRAFSAQSIPALLAIKGDRFDYEMNILVALRSLQLELVTVPIQTIYEDNNEQTHFRPIHDSIRVYRSLLTFFLSSLASSFVDVGCFMVLLIFFGASPSNLLLITVIARVISGIVNYSLNKRYVFQDKQQTKNSLWKYTSLFCFQMVLSWAGVALVSLVLPSVLLTKLLVDCLLFFFSYHIQQRFIFNQKKKEASHAPLLP